jgi:hypothetical protein
MQTKNQTDFEKRKQQISTDVLACKSRKTLVNIMNLYLDLPELREVE